MAKGVKIHIKSGLTTTKHDMDPVLGRIPRKFPDEGIEFTIVGASKFISDDTLRRMARAWVIRKYKLRPYKVRTEPPQDRKLRVYIS